MKKVIFGILVGLIAGGIAVRLLPRQHADEGKKAPEEHKVESHAQRGTNGEVIVRLDKETQARAGLKTAALAAAQVPAEMKGYGHVLDPVPLAGLVVDMDSARAALEASTRDFQRLKILHEQDRNVSTRSLETAEAVVKHDQIIMDAARHRLTAAWGKTVAGQIDLSALVRLLMSQEAALARIDLPLGESLKSAPAGGRIAALTSEESPLEAEYVGPAASADPQTQGQGFLFLLKSHPLPPGAALIGWLRISGDPRSGVIVPREALLRHGGEPFVYVQTGEETFERRRAGMERPSDGGWFVMEGLKPGDKVVTTGAQQLLSEELKSQNQNSD